MVLELCFLALLGVFLGGYRLGRVHGRTEGLDSGFAAAPIELKRRSMLGGRCTICGSIPSASWHGEGKGEAAQNSS